MPELFLTAGRAADRKRMVALLQNLCATDGAECIVTQPAHFPRCYRIEVNMGLARISIDIDGDSRQNRAGVIVATWNLTSDAVRSGYQFTGEGHHKSTRIWYTFGELLGGLIRDFARIRAGEFYSRFRWSVYDRTTATDPFVQSFVSAYDAGLCARDWQAAKPSARFTIEREAA